MCYRSSSADALSELSAELKKKARALGLGPTLVTSPRRSARFEQYLDWLAKGYHGEMAYMARPDRIARRENPHVILPRAQAVVMTTLFYWPGTSGFPESHHIAPPAKRPASQGSANEKKAAGASEGAITDGRDAHGIVSSYAWGTDYHALLEERLRELGEWLHSEERGGGVGRFYVDTGAVLERDFGERAGLGFVGKNSLLIHPRAGSGFFLGALFTSVALPADGDADGDAAASGPRGRPGCGRCQRCIDACPTGAIVGDRVVDARRCISYLTIELSGDIPESLRAAMGRRVYGCDICQVVCPWNSFDWAPHGNQLERGHARSPLFGAVTLDVASPRLAVLLWETADGFARRFRGTAVERIGRERLARNAAVALGNGSVDTSADVCAVAVAAVAHWSPVVRRHASWALARMRERRVNMAEQSRRAA